MPDARSLARQVVLSPAEAAELLGITRASVYNLIDRGELRRFKVGRLTKLRTADVLGLVGGAPEGDHDDAA